tara:strand:- start:1002 stop:1199 length:198 start_codon:yes stop_codon:yes gene_type:complete
MFKKKVAFKVFDDVEIIENININWYSEKELKNIRESFIVDLKVISTLRNCSIQESLNIWKKQHFN